jgi:hypothetical protein
MSLARGGFKIAVGFACTYALVWGNWDSLMSVYNDR